MKNVFIFWVLILLPVGIIIYLSFSNLITSFQLGILLVLYYCYRAIIDGIRLKQLGLIKKAEIWKLFIPFFKISIFQNISKTLKWY
jgi:hypothetical protein